MPRKKPTIDSEAWAEIVFALIIAWIVWLWFQDWYTFIKVWAGGMIVGYLLHWLIWKDERDFWKDGKITWQRRKK